MGCTSSVPNMADIQSNAAGDEKDETHSVKQQMPNKDKDDENNIAEKEETNSVLPTCDNLNQNIQLARNNYSINFSDQQVENDDQINNIKEQTEIPLPDTEQETEKDQTNLKDLVEQVISDNVLQSTENISTLSDTQTESKEIEEEIQEKPVEIQEKSNEDALSEPKEEEEINIEESVSPSQSECSRATRWEALADIAAELPASLAVDPLTGQIYSLGK